MLQRKLKIHEHVRPQSRFLTRRPDTLRLHPVTKSVDQKCQASLDTAVTADAPLF